MFVASRALRSRITLARGRRRFRFDIFSSLLDTPPSRNGGAYPAINGPPSDPALAHIIDAWPTLPEPIRKAMLALAESGK